MANHRTKGAPDRNLTLRAASAAVGIPVLVAAVLLGMRWVAALAAVAGLLASYELARLSGVSGMRKWAVAAPAAVLVAAGIAVAGSDGDPDTSRAAGVVAGASAAVALATAITLPAAASKAAVLAAWAAIYFGAFLAHAPAVMTREHGSDWMFVALLGTFAADSAAYFTGRAIGRHKLAPRISPKKTWEGFAGGLMAGPVAVLLVNAVIGPGIAVWRAALIGLAIAVLAALGDLAESALKRATGVKDSGALIPGHGGILDRIDSLAPNFLTVYLAAIWNGH